MECHHEKACWNYHRRGNDWYASLRSKLSKRLLDCWKHLPSAVPRIFANDPSARWRPDLRNVAARKFLWRIPIQRQYRRRQSGLQRNVAELVGSKERRDGAVLSPVCGVTF